MYKEFIQSKLESKNMLDIQLLQRTFAKFDVHSIIDDSIPWIEKYY
jgi:hypothetical protein